jgi:dihydrodipicolinate synthase/N-acetylneuraminate lyase
MPTEIAQMSPEIIAAVQQHIEKARVDLERELQRAIADVVDVFKERTNLTPSAIVVESINVTACNGGRPTFIIGKVHAKVDM